MRFFTVVLSGLALLAQGSALRAQVATHPADTTKVERARFAGKVAGIDRASHQLLIDAVRTPGAGLAMTLPYRADSAQIARFKVGDSVTGQVITSRHRTYLTNVRLASQTAPRVAPRPKAPRPARRAPTGPQPEIERWAFVGRVQGVNESANQLVIDAQKAPGTGPVMTVPYQAANRKELAGYKAGDKVRGRI